METNWHDYFKQVKDLLVEKFLDMRMAPGAQTQVELDNFERQAWIAWSSGRTALEFAGMYALGEWRTDK